MRLTPQMRLLLLIIIALPALATAAPKNELVKPELLADVSAITPGQPFHLGIHLKIASDWHIYWKNPGDSGAPTTVDFKLPDGFKLEALEFPAPYRFEQPGPIISFGYHDEVMLIATITPPKDLAPGTKVPITANISWLCCKKICIQ